MIKAQIRGKKLEADLWIDGSTVNMKILKQADELRRMKVFKHDRVAVLSVSHSAIDSSLPSGIDVFIRGVITQLDKDIAKATFDTREDAVEAMGRISGALDALDEKYSKPEKTRVEGTWITADVWKEDNHVCMRILRQRSDIPVCAALYRSGKFTIGKRNCPQLEGYSGFIWLRGRSTCEDDWIASTPRATTSVEEVVGALRDFNANYKPPPEVTRVTGKWVTADVWEEESRTCMKILEQRPDIPAEDKLYESGCIVVAKYARPEIHPSPKTIWLRGCNADGNSIVAYCPSHQMSAEEVAAALRDFNDNYELKTSERVVELGLPVFYGASDCISLLDELEYDIKDGRYDAVELHEVGMYHEAKGCYQATVEDGDPDPDWSFWSLFGHMPGRGLETLGDFRDLDTARACLCLADKLVELET